MSALVELANLRHLTRHPAQLWCALLGLALGVAAVVAIDLSIDSTTGAFELTTRALVGNATHVVRGGANGIAPATYAELVRRHPTIRAAPVLERDVRTEIGERRRWTLLGVDPLAQSAFTPWLPPPGGPNASSPGISASGSSDVWLAASTARELGLARGDTFELELESWRERVRVAGLIETSDALSERALASLVVADLAVADRLAHANGRLSRIDLALAREPELAGDSQRELASLGAELGPELTLEPADRRRKELADMSAALRFNLRVLSWLALFVGAFLVYDAVTFSVVQRRELFGRLRALGASRAAIFRAVCFEAAWIGWIGSSLGLVFGESLARAIVPLFARTLNDMYAPIGRVGVTSSVRVWAVGLVLGLAATELAALLPALEAASAPPRTSMTRSRLEESVARFAVPLALGALVLALGACALAALPSHGLAPAFGALFLGLLAVPLAVPWLVARFAALAAPLAGRAFGVVGAIAARSLGASLSRTAVAAAALTVALGTSLAMASAIASFRSTLEDWLALTLRADVFVSAPHAVISRVTSQLDPGFIERAKQLPGIATFSQQRGIELESSLGLVYLVGLEEPEEGRRKFRFLRANAGEVWSRVDRGEAIASEAFARRHALEPGDSFELPTANGRRRFTLAGIFQDFTSEQGYAAISRGSYVSAFGDTSVSSMAFYLARGVDPSAFARSIDDLLGPNEHVNVYSNRDLRDGSLEVFDQTFAVAVALQFVATLIAAIACVSSLAALEFERASELALLRAEGLTRAGAAKLIAIRSALLGAFAGAFATPLGVAVSFLLVDVLQPRAFGWTLDWHFEPWLCVRTFALAVVAALAAAVLPAWFATRANPAVVLRAE